LPSNFSISKFYDVNGFRNYVYEFSLKSIGEDIIRIDSRESENKNVYKYFLPDNFESLDDHQKEETEKRAMKRERNYRVKFA
jgi:hypothetical protein